MSRSGFDRGILRVLAIALLLLIAGCNAGQPTTTETPEPTTTMTDAGTAHESTATTTSDDGFTASVAFPNCQTVQVSGDSYSWVGVFTANNATEYSGNYTGSNEFSVNATVMDVVVRGEGGEVDVSNPAYGECTAPETTQAPTTEVTTVEPTPTTVVTTQAPTTTPTPTTTETVHHTHTTQTTTREPLRDHKITTHVQNETLEQGYTKVRVKNWHEDTVSLNYHVVWYEDRDIVENVDGNELVLDPGESVTLESYYEGNGSAYEVEYTVNQLRYTDQ